MDPGVAGRKAVFSDSLCNSAVTPARPGRACS